MGFFKKFQLGKVIGGAVQGFASGGFKGALAQGGAAALVATSGAAGSRASKVTPSGSAAQFGGLQTSFQGGYQMPGNFPVADTQPFGLQVGLPAKQVPKDIISYFAAILGRLGLIPKNPANMVSVGRKVLAKLLRFARAHPGLTIVALLINLGLGVFEANQLISWYTVTGKKRRRMHVTNVKALKRSARRLEGFRKLACRVELALATRASSSPRRRAARCGTCRKSPCRC